MNIQAKLQIILKLVYENRFAAMASDLGVSSMTVRRWLSGSPIGSDMLLKLQEKGINIAWLMNAEDKDLNAMFTDTAVGKALRIRCLGEHYGREEQPGG